MLAALAPQVLHAAPYFTLSTYKTFAPGDKPKLHLYTRDVNALEFRVYHVQDPEKFVSALSEMHSFGDPSHAPSVTEQIDEKTWLERFHDWKQSLWHNLKNFFREQLSRPTREAFKTKQSSLAQRSRIVGVAQFAQVPLLNDKQLVARWTQQVPPTFVSDNQVLPIDSLPRGMYLVEATDGRLKAYTILMVSQTALVTRTVAGQLIGFVVDRRTGAPVPQASVTLALGTSKRERQSTSAEGIATFNTPPATSSQPGEDGSDTTRNPLWVLSRSGDDLALVGPWYSSFVQQAGEQYASYTYTDRPVYRPGHTVHFRSILRQRAGDALVLPTPGNAHVTISDSDGKKLFDKQLPLSAMGSVQGELQLPPDAALGYDNISVSVGDREQAGGNASFRVEDYRKPEYQVRVAVAKQRVLQGENNTATIDARYFFGEPVSNAKVKVRVFQSSHFWWGDPAEEDENGAGLGTGSPDAASDDPGDQNTSAGDQNSEQQGRLNADGTFSAKIATAFVPENHTDQDYVVEGAVTDEAGREITARYRFLATCGSFRLHIEPLSYAVEQGGEAKFRITAVDYDNKPVQTSVHLNLYQHKTSPRGLSSEDTTLAGADVNTGKDGTAIASLPVRVAGSIDAVASANTPEKRSVQDHAWLWVSASGASGEEGEGDQPVQIIADKKIYAPGDIAHLTLISQAENYHALVTATGYTAEFRRVLSSTGHSLRFDLPITHDSQPNLTVDAVFIQDDKLYQAHRSIKVPPVQQQLQITVTPAAGVFQPGQAAMYDVAARDWKGNPVQAELSFGVVDEAIYSLYPDASGDIVKALYPDRATYPDLESSLTYYFTGEAGLRSPTLAERHARYRPQLAQVKPDNDAKAPRIRKAFPDTALWQPQVRTDAQGHARVSLNYPDSLTTWRATVHAITADAKAGSAVNRVLVRKNIIVRMGQPRFLRKGDTVTVPVIVHNYLQTAKQIGISLDATGVDLINGGGPRQVTVPARAETSVNYQLHATSIGNAKLTAKAITSEESDALEVTLPIEPAGVRETLAASGVLGNNGDRSTSVTFPAGTDAAAHTLRIEASPSVAGSLFSALDYLTTFPYGCTEQTMSSFLPNIIVSQAMRQLHIPSRIDPAVLRAKIDAGLTRLQDYHHDDGGWGWWKEDNSQVFMTAYVVGGLSQAKKAGYDRAGPIAAQGIAFLHKQLDEHPRMLPELRAYVVYALAEAGSADRKQLDILWSRRSGLSAQALAYTGLAMLDIGDDRVVEIASLLAKQANIEGDVASWPAARNNLLDIDYDESAASTAFVLKFLTRQDPTNPLLPKAAQWLVANRSQGAWWGSTQDTAFVLYGLTDYLAASHELNADLDIEVLVNGNSVGHQHFSREDALQGHTLSLTIDAAHLQAATNSVHIVTHGTGKLYWSTQANYFSTAKHSYQQGTMALNIARDYFLLTPTQRDGHIVYHLQPLHAPVAPGDVLAVHLGVTGSPQKYLLIEDPIPSGTEFLQRTDGYNIEDRPNTWDAWYTRQEFHDDRAAIFSTAFDGRHDSFYLLKVTNPGSFEISPARVTPMYQPGVQATSDALHLDVKEATK